MRTLIVTNCVALDHDLVRSLTGEDLLVLMGDAVLVESPRPGPTVVRSSVDLRVRGRLDETQSSEAVLSDSEIVGRVQASRQVIVL
jgi:hypothetical protein